MPLYEYKCGEGHVTEKLVNSSLSDEEKNLQPCKECGRPADRVVSTQTSFALKGKWFKTTGGY